MTGENNEITAKALEKMTVKDLRDFAKDLPGIVGVSGMKKDELIVRIKEAKGIQDEPVKKADASVADIKKKIKALKAQRQSALEARDAKMATIYKRRISRLKKKSRRAAALSACLSVQIRKCRDWPLNTVNPESVAVDIDVVVADTMSFSFDIAHLSGDRILGGA